MLADLLRPSSGYARRRRSDFSWGACAPPRRFATSLPRIAFGEPCWCTGGARNTVLLATSRREVVAAGGRGEDSATKERRGPAGSHEKDTPTEEAHQDRRTRPQRSRRAQRKPENESRWPG